MIEKRPTLIGYGGVLRSGKDASADYLVERHGFKKVFMSDPLAQALYELDPFIPGVLFPERDERDIARYSELVDAVGYTDAKTHPEVRRLLQVLGTEVGRKIIGEDTWVNIAAASIEKFRDEGHPVVITGIRYPNELRMIQRLGGMLVWMDRATVATSTHDSENSVRADEFDGVIYNHGTLEDLYRETRALVSNA